MQRYLKFIFTYDFNLILLIIRLVIIIQYGHDIFCEVLNQEFKYILIYFWIKISFIIGQYHLND